MTKSKRFVLWLAEKLDVDLENHFRNQIIPEDQEEFTRFTEEEFELHTFSSVQAFVSKWLKDSEAKKDDIIKFTARLLEDFDAGFQNYNKQNPEDIVELLRELGVDETEDSAAHFIIQVGEDHFDMDFKELYRPKDASQVAEDIDKARKNDDEEKDDIGFVEFLEYVALEKGVQEELEEKYDSNPVEQIFELEDSQDKMYLWKLPSEWSEQKRDNLFARLVSSYREKFSRDPKSAHLLLTELDELQEVDRDEMKELLGWAGEDL